MSNTSNASKPQKIRKPFGPLTQPSHLPIAIAEALQQAEAGSATCGHCANVAQTLTNLQAFVDEWLRKNNPSPPLGKDISPEVERWISKLEID